MKVEAKKRTNLMVGAMLLVAVVATAFWILALSPKREEASKLDTQVKQLESSLAQHESEVVTAEGSTGGISRSTTSTWSCSARRCPATTKPRRCWFR